MSIHLISEDAGELIIEQEVSGEAVYKKRYQHPERPGGQSGITVGIGYDCGYSTAAQVRQDWGGRIPDAMVEVMATRCAKLTGAAAQARLAEVRPKVTVPWDAAIAEFYDVEVPRWLAKCRAVLPNLDKLPPDCIGALVSLAYNRGPSFALAGARYAEMRAIRAHMAAKEFRKIPGEFRAMKRLWPQPSMRGLIGRREAEAKLFERGLASMPALVADLDPVADDAADGDQIDARAPAPNDPADDRHLAVDPATTAAAPPNVVPLEDPDATGDPVLFNVQKRLKARRYSPGTLDGRWGSGTSGALGGFMNDRGLRLHMPGSLEEFHEIADEVLTELTEAETETQPDGSVGWYRPVSEARANADPKIVKELAPETVPVKRNFFAALWTSVVAGIGGIWEAVKDYVSETWDFFTDHKDVIDDHPGIMSTAWSYVTSVPSAVWLLLGAAGLAFIAFNSWSAIKTSTQAIKTGERQ